jgi:hypothetical protein
MGIILAVSFLQGLLDMILVGLLARMVGLLAGVKLDDQIPGIRFFGGGLLAFVFKDREFRTFDNVLGGVVVGLEGIGEIRHVVHTLPHERVAEIPDRAVWLTM